VAQINEAFDDFEGNSNIPAWVGDDCMVNPSFTNPFPGGENTSSTVLSYQDNGGTFANVRFDMSDRFDLSTNQTFSLQIYIPSNSISGNQPNQVSLKLQDGSLPEPWSTQSEIIKPVSLDTWQTITFDFEKDNFINLDGGSLPPTARTDFNRVVIQVNGENNTDPVIAYIDNILLYNSQVGEPVFDQLVWSDEFDEDGAADPEKWHFQTVIPDGNSWFNGEIQHYTDRIDNTFVENGTLKIVAKKETYTNQGITKEYTSARLNSKFAFTYGRVEVRAKLPTGVGTWPAIWLLGKNINETGAYWQTQGFGNTGWPDCGELDIMEHWGDNQDYVSSAIHTPSSFGATVNTGGRILPNASNEFHTYTMVWTEDEVEFGVDGVTHYTYNPDVKNDATWPFYEDQYIIFNIAILPIIASNFTESPMEIDYIRIYQEGTPTSVVEPQEDSKLVYPNPFHDELTITTEAISKEPIDIKLYYSNGTLVKTYTESINEGVFQLNGLRNLPKGMYVIQYTIGEITYKHKAIKAN